MVVPPKHPKMIILVGKAMVAGYHHFRKPLYGESRSFWAFFWGPFPCRIPDPRKLAHDLDEPVDPLIRATSTGWFVTKMVGKLVSHRIHVWYIYLHQWLICYNKCRQIYHSSSHGSGKFGILCETHGKNGRIQSHPSPKWLKARSTIQRQNCWVPKAILGGSSQLVSG